MAVDFSDDSAGALLWAAEAASCWKAPLVVLHVVHDPGSAPGYYSRATKKKHLHRLEEAAEEMMAEFLARQRKSLAAVEEAPVVERRLVVGLPVNRILEVADEIGARSIVMGSQGRTGLPHLLLGSKAERVVRLASVPVTIVKSGKPKKGKKDRRGKR